MVSYSMYLVHWPIIVFATHLNGGRPSVMVLMAILAATILLAAVMYKVVEQPIRARQFSLIRNLSNAGVGLVAAMLCLMVVLFGVTYGAGIVGKQTRDLNLDQIVRDGKAFTWKHIHKQNRAFSTDQIGDKVLLIGDSQAADFLNLLWAFDPKFAKSIRTFPSDKFCQFKYTPSFYDSGDYKGKYTPPKNQLKECRGDLEHFVSDRRVETADIIILASAWYSVATNYLAADLAELKKRNPNAKYFIVGRKDQTNSSVTHLLNGLRPVQANLLARQKPNPEVLAINTWLAGQNMIDYLDVFSAFCGPTKCDLFTSSGYPVLFDKRHLTLIGADYVVRGNAFRTNIAGPLGLISD